LLGIGVREVAGIDRADRVAEAVEGGGDVKRSTETDLVRACLQYLALQGILAWRVNCGAAVATHQGKRRFVRFASRTGLPDICAILPGGKALFVEAKSPGGRLRPSQREFLTLAGGAGALCLVVRGVGELIDALREDGVGG
jgi:hypothetical protein